jgi:hypothetical protein
MFTDFITWASTGIIFIFAYILISNTLWLLFGSRLLQSLPGVNIRGARGTLKIAVMLVLFAVGVARWIYIYLHHQVFTNTEKPKFKIIVSSTIKRGSRFFKRRARSEKNPHEPSTKPQPTESSGRTSR